MDFFSLLSHEVSVSLVVFVVFRGFQFRIMVSPVSLEKMPVSVAKILEDRTIEAPREGDARKD